MGKRVVNNNEKCWCVNGSGCQDPTLGRVFERNKEKYELAKEDRKFKEMNKEITHILSKYGYVLNGPMKVINEENGKHRNIWR